MFWLRTLTMTLALAVVPAASASAIVGGQTTTRDWPHMAGMEYRGETLTGEEIWDFRCGGSLVAPDVVLTAAHCVSGIEEDGEPDTFAARDFRFILGTKRRSAGGERIGATQILEHPKYDETDGEEADVALVKLERSTTLGRPIPLAQPADKPFWEPGDLAVVIGWGTEFFKSPFIPDNLKEATVPIVSDAECQRSFEFTFGFDPDTFVCAGEKLGGEDSCQGDSGGPLHVQDATGAWKQVGVVSYGLGCAFPTQYGAYSEVGGDVLRPWVEENAARMSTAGSTTTGSSPQPASTGATTTRTAGTAFPTPLATRVLLPARLGSARLSRRLRRVLVRVGASAPLRRVRVVLRQRGRTVASGGAASLRGTRTLRLRTRRGLRSGTARLVLTATDEAGRRVTAGRRVRLRR